jgi:hypothetical protein
MFRRGWRWWLGAVLVLLVAWGWAAAAGGVPDECTGYRSPTQEACRYFLSLRHGVEAIARWVEGNDKIVVAIGTAFIAIFTATLWWTTLGLWRASQQQSTDMRDSIDAMEAVGTALAEGNRPHILMATLSVRGFRGAAAENGFVKLGWTHRLQNYGRSPALLGRSGMKIRTAPALLPIPDYDDLGTERFIVPPGGWWGSLDGATVEVRASERDKVLAGDEQLFVFGFVEYRDTRGTRHRHAWCYRFVFDDGPNSVAFVPAGNDAYWENT